MAGGVSVSRLGRAFRGMDIAVDRLKVGQSPIIEQLRPWSMPVFAPNPKQREAAGRQKAKANAATKRMPHPMTAIGTGS